MQGEKMGGREIFLDDTRKHLLTALEEFQGGRIKCGELPCQECPFYSGHNPAGNRCEIVNIELSICRLLKAMEKEGQ
jgi:hypothetical protein